MKAVVLSCNTGEGHNTAGKAVYHKFLQMGVECDFVDTLSIAGTNVSRTVDHSYVGITTSVPAVFGMMYSIGRAVSDINTRHLHMKSPVYAANTLYRKKLAKFIIDGGYDVAVMPHLFPAECLTSLKKHGALDIPFICVATDYACIPFWEETKPDYFIIPHAGLAEDFYSRDIPKDKLLPFGIPVDDKFKAKTDRAEARRQLGIPDDKPVLLLMSGSMGFGGLEGMTRALYEKFGRNVRIILMCGRNESMREHLGKAFTDIPDIILQPFTDRVSLFMDASDIVFTKPGGLSSTEAAVKNVLLVHTPPIPGCETINAAFFSSRGMSVSPGTNASPEAIADAAYSLWLDKDVQKKMLAAQRENINPEAADEICRFILKKYSK
ncbi:MAG: glycosyl transferase [Clostridia bacterium]|nr:glycosyl transferase [Clostridia bacterium]